MKFALALLHSTAAVAIATAQSNAPQFEVAAFRISQPEGDSININLGTVRNGRVTLDNVTLSDCIKFAYGLVADAQLAGPDWIRSDPRFNIAAQAPLETPREQLLLMTQELLADRLHLVLRREQKEQSYLGLVLAKGGATMRAAEADPAYNAGVHVRGRIADSHMSMARLTLLLSRFERQTILDRTGLSGLFDVKLAWTPETGSEPTRTEEKPRLFEAVQKQLGLKLESNRGPLEVLVVEHANKTPEEN